MRLDAKSGVRGLLWNQETGQLIRWCRWAELPDDPQEPGSYEAWRFHPDECRERHRAGQPEETLVVRGTCRLRFVPAAPVYGPKPTSARDLAGSLDEARRRYVHPKLLVPGEECQEPGCHRLSEWRVSWEQEIEPEADARGWKHERAVTVRVCCYCSKHYRLPRFTSTRGVESEVPVEEARPQ